ncbi:MAG: OBAP family protein [Methylomonas sp.]|jgi:hypothetical protein|uniref:DUF1264 domain-containing protein n=1 Tax=Methylomonas sp. TaxID=418 RepID=UPI0025F7D3C1|nr:DUF1264 domain-containing protein [Methylomonas sp.]MCK9605721.1 OBAP family protein [Methylomonas sp.]
MKITFLIAGTLMALAAGASTAAPATAEIEHGHAATAAAGQVKLYNETLNPRQIEHPNHLGFNDLHIQAIRHLVPDTHSVRDPKLQTVVHHHCKAYEDETMVCLMFHSGMKDQDKPIGFEYIITTAQFNSLPEAEKKYWHYHKTEVPRAHATFPDLTRAEAAKILPAVNETYGKVIYFQQPEDKFPLGEPYVVIVQDMPEQD